MSPRPLGLAAARRMFPILFGVAGFVTLVSQTACVSDDPGPPPAKPSCGAYCTLVAKNCGGDKQQYRSTTECEKACATMDLGNADDGDVNSVGCRMRQAESATTLDQCIAAGPFGGGVCGSRCASFCRMLGRNCTTQPTPPFNSEASCNEGCPGFRFDTTEGEGPLQQFNGRNTLNCRSHHLVLSLDDPNTHCAHAGVVSATCTL